MTRSSERTAVRKRAAVALAMIAGAATVAAAAPQVAWGQAATTSPQAVPRSGSVLGLDQAIALARSGQPSVAAFEREATASEQAAVAARSLSDLEVSAGVQNFPISGRDAFSPTADFMTMYTIGVMREQVRRSRREAEAARWRAEAVVSRSQGTVQQRRIERDVTIAWINAVEAAARQRLLAQVVSDLRVGQQVMEAGIPTGASTPALALQAQAEIALAQAQLAAARGAEARARGELARWIGPEGQRLLPPDVPLFALPPEAGGKPGLVEHPEIRAAQAQEQAAQRQVDVTRSERRPNLSWSVMYGFRPSFGDMLSAQVSVPLQLNHRNLQDRRTAEAQARADAARLRTEDIFRELGGSLAAALADHRSAQEQITVLREQAIPALDASFKAAEARYASGQGTLDLPLSVVRRYVEANIQLLEQQGARARAAAEIIYLTGEPTR